MKLLFLQYPSCGTCRKAAKWLWENNIEIVSRHIVDENPSEKELSVWIEKSGLPILKFFNTSGQLYKEHNLKNIVRTASNEELIRLLAQSGKLIKRPILVADDFVLVGFDEMEWGNKLKNYVQTKP
ncbi:MAG: Regulatory protein MgsR [Bacteroidetes bacterium ADurb.BinA261]|jgi:arsenate reductase|nr:MAG: Regulatory protein MgsR [Bacteroidetes bacterium ADurb.BinA261]